MIQVAIGFSTADGWISKVIRWFTRSTFSHSFLVIRDEPMIGPAVFESDSGGVQLITLKAFLGGNRIVREVAPLIDLFPAIVRCADLLGEEYDYAGLLGMAWVELWWRVFKWKVRNPLHNSNQFFCSAFVVKVMQAAGWPDAERLDPAATDAQMLSDFIDAHPA